MVSSMKATIEIPDALALEAKQVARRGGVTLRELVVAGLRGELDRRANAPRVDFTFPTVAGQGLVADVRPEDVLARSYGLPE